MLTETSFHLITLYIESFILKYDKSVKAVIRNSGEQYRRNWDCH